MHILPKPRGVDLRMADTSRLEPFSPHVIASSMSRNRMPTPSNAHRDHRHEHGHEHERVTFQPYFPAGVTRAIFSDIVMENFTALSLDDREVELKPGGKNIPVTWDNRLE